MTPFVADTDFTLYVGDVRQVLAELPEGSVDCCVTSPPYFGLRDYGTNGQIGLEATPELFVAEMVAVFRDVRRVLADHGTCWINLGDSYNSAASNQRNELIGGWDAGMDRSSTIDKNLKPKDLVGIPWRVAFALQADGWWLRSDIVWAKPNPMPESVTDRPTKSHEYVFMLTKQPRYFFDQEAVREPHTRDWGGDEGLMGSGRTRWAEQAGRNDANRAKPPQFNPSGRNVRTVWEIATQPYAEAHFATFPEALPERCIKAGCPERVCATCGTPRTRIVETNNPSKHAADPDNTLGWANTHSKTSNAQSSKSMHRNPGGVYSTAQTVGWSDCGHNNWRAGRVLDPFMGSGTTALVARRLGRHSVGVELNPDYAALCARRLQQLSLLAEEPAA